MRIFKSLKTKFAKWRAAQVVKFQKWLIMRETKKFAKLMPTDSVYDRPRTEDNHVINTPPVPAALGKILDIKSAEIREHGRFWYASKKEDISGTTEYEIRDNKQCQEAFKKLQKEQRPNSTWGGY